MSNKSGVSADVIALPQGGGAVQGIGETFSADLFTGTGNATVPLVCPQGRNGLQPDLSLTYSSGSGNGPFGLGWSVSVAGISRKTSDGVPRYRDDAADPAEHDVFILTGAEDLVPVAESEDGVEHRPRTEGLFARIRRVRRPEDDFWRVEGREGLVSTYGVPGARGADPAAVADPADRSRVCAWRLSETRDPFGNRMRYRHVRDAGAAGPHSWDQLYLHAVDYVDHTVDGEERFLVSVAFVYEERPDPFSTRRPGFEVRTRWRCRRVEIRTHSREDALVGTYELTYLDDRVRAGELPDTALPRNGVSLLSRVQLLGHDQAETQALPPLELGYTPFQPAAARVEPVHAIGGGLPPRSLAGDDIDLVDLFGNGLPDIVQLDGQALFWRNLGGGAFDRPQTMPEVPSGVRLEDPGVRFADLNGNGRADLLVTDLGGYFPLGFAGRWSREGFVRYDHAPTFPLGSADLRLVDIDGDGVVDALHTGEQLTVFHNDRTRGWDRVEAHPRRPLEEFPDVRLSSPQVKLADMTGDGLQDIVLVSRGRVDYWPNRGHGAWGQRITMDAGPQIDDPLAPALGFDPDRLLLGDVDGDGVVDVLYVERDRVTVWINRGGNGFAPPFTIEGTPTLTEPDAVRLVDLLGVGSSGILWTADEAGPGTDPYRFLDLTGGGQPNLLDEMTNHLGAVTRVAYSSSTSAYLEDESRPAARWRTPLPFPVQVVTQVETIDQLSGGKLTAEYRYHHGYWDGAEREFRGFGRVDRLDTETFRRFNDGGLHGHQRFTGVDEDQFSPPTLTKTWFHLGPVGDEVGIRRELDVSVEHWPWDPSMLERPRDVADLLDALDDQARADALRSLRGSQLRTESFALDGTPRQERPYAVAELVHGLREEQRPDLSSQRVFFPHVRAERTTQWERGDDPMTRFAFDGDHDDVGQARTRTQIACPRGWRRLDDRPGRPYLATRRHTTYAVPARAEIHIADRAAQVTAHEIRNDGTQRVLELLSAAEDGQALAVIGQTEHHYDGEPFVGRPLGEVGEHGALMRTETLVLPGEVLRDAYRGDAADATGIPPYLDPDASDAHPDYPADFHDLLAPLAGYTFRPGRGYFVTTARHRYDHQTPGGRARGLLTTSRDPFGGDTTIAYDAYGLLPVEVVDPVGLVTRATYDHSALQPREVTDPNGNRTRFAYTPLGLLRSVASMGKADEEVGDTDDVPGTTYDHDLLAFVDGRPAATRTTRRVHHVQGTDAARDDRESTVVSVEYADGFGRSLQVRTLAEDISFGDPLLGTGLMPADPATPPGDVEGSRRPPGDPPAVVVTGARVHDNKGQVVQQFEPYFARGLAYAEPDPVGQHVTMFHDPRGEVIRTVNPDGSEQRVLFGVPGSIAVPDLTDPAVIEPTPWEAYTYDANDNADRTHPSGGRADPTHVDTPSSIEVDALGRVVRAVERNGPDPASDWFTTRTAYDISGNVVAVTDALGREALRCTYDLADHALRVEHIDGGVRRTVLDAAGDEIERRDSRGALILHGFDLLRRPVRVWARDGAEDRVTLRERLQYGDGGDPAQDPAARDAHRAENRLGALHQHHDEAGLLTFERYDFKGNVLDKVRQVISDEAILRTAAATTAEDPGAGRPFRIDWAEPPAPLPDDRADVRLEGSAHRTTARYDALNRATMILLPEDVSGHRRELRSTYDRAGNLLQVALDGETFVDHIAYDARGQRTFIALGNGVMTRYAHDPVTHRLRRRRSERYTKPDPEAPVYRRRGAPLEDVAYDHDLAGNITAMRDRSPESGLPASPLGPDGLDRVFAYDPLYRLVSATGRECDRAPVPFPPPDRPRCTDWTRTRAYTERYRYDPLGNTEELRHLAGAGTFTRRFTMTGDGNRLASVTVGDGRSSAYVHDANGNLVRENLTRRFAWDHSDRMTAFETRVEGGEPSRHASYLYDADGQRVKKLVRDQGGGFETTTYMDGVFEHHRWQGPGGSGGANNRVHVLDEQGRVALVRVGDPHPDDRGPAVEHHLGDHLGSTTIVVDGSGDVVRREEFLPYGETSFGSYARKRYRHAGRERDEESGLSHHGARYYAPGLARWISADPPAVSAESTDTASSPYAPFACNPLLLVDDDGRSPNRKRKARRRRAHEQRQRTRAKEQEARRAGRRKAAKNAERQAAAARRRSWARWWSDDSVYDHGSRFRRFARSKWGQGVAAIMKLHRSLTVGGGPALMAPSATERAIEHLESERQRITRRKQRRVGSRKFARRALKAAGRVLAPIALLTMGVAAARAAQAALRRDFGGALREIVDATFVGDLIDLGRWGADLATRAWSALTGGRGSILEGIAEGLGDALQVVQDAGATLLEGIAGTQRTAHVITKTLDPALLSVEEVTDQPDFWSGAGSDEGGNTPTEGPAPPVPTNLYPSFEGRF